MATQSDGRRRVTKACERCRTKKIKCCGSVPCSRCEADRVACTVEPGRKDDDKPVSAHRADELQFQRDVVLRALRVLWQSRQNHTMGASADGVGGYEPSIRTIIESTGIAVEPSELTSILANWDAEPTPNTIPEPRYNQSRPQSSNAVPMVGVARADQGGTGADMHSGAGHSGASYNYHSSYGSMPARSDPYARHDDGGDIRYFGAPFGNGIQRSEDLPPSTTAFDFDRPSYS